MEISLNTLLGFETTGPCPGFRVVRRWAGRIVVASLWWWGVVFDLWIVVASIKKLQRNASPLFWGWGVVVWCFVVQFLFESIGFVFVSV